MSIQHFVPAIWQNALEESVRQKQVIANRVRIIGEEFISAFGDQVLIHDLDKMHVKPYLPDDTEGAPVVLTVEHGTYFNVFVPDVDRSQRENYESIKKHLENSAERIAIESDHYLVQKLCEKAGTRISMNRPTNADQICDFIIKFFAEVVNKAGKDIDISVCIPAEFEACLVHDPRFSIKQVGEETRAYCCGIQITGSWDLPDKALAIDNTTVAYAGKVARLTAYCPEKGFFDGVKGLYLFGANVIEPEKVCVCEFI